MRILQGSLPPSSLGLTRQAGMHTVPDDGTSCQSSHAMSSCLSTHSHLSGVPRPGSRGRMGLSGGRLHLTSDLHDSPN